MGLGGDDFLVVLCTCSYALVDFCRDGDNGGLGVTIPAEPPPKPVPGTIAALAAEVGHNQAELFDDPEMLSRLLEAFFPVVTLASAQPLFAELQVHQAAKQQESQRQEFLRRRQQRRQRRGSMGTLSTKH